MAVSSQTIDPEGLLRRHGVNYRLAGGGKEAVAPCPKCGSSREKPRSWSVNLETGVFICNRQESCGWAGSWYDLLDHFGERGERRQPARIHALPSKPKSYKKPDHSKVKGLTDEHLGWFKGRAISPETVKAFRISGKPGAIAFPVFDPDGKLVNIKWRAVAEKRFWNEEGTLKLPFGIQAVPPDAKTLTITEGEMDALAAWEYGCRSVISTPNGTKDLDWIDPLWDWLERFEVIYLALDMDPVGQDGVKRLVARLGAWRCRMIEIPEPHKDFNDLLMAGAAKDVFDFLFEDAADFRPEKLANAADFTEQVVAAFEDKGKLIGVPCGFPGLNDIMKGWRGGELSVWSGQNGSGKSTILGQEMLSLVAKGERVCIASLELAAARYLRWLVCQWTDMANPWSAKVREAMYQMSQGLWLVDHVGKMDPASLLEIFAYAARRYGVRHFVVDSLVKLSLKGDRLEAEERVVSMLADFADEFDAHMHLVAHPRKGEKDGDRPGKVDIRGSAAITDLADNVFIVVRNKDAKPGMPSALLYNAKHREHGTEGVVPLTVDPDTKRVRQFGTGDPDAEVWHAGEVKPRWQVEQDTTVDSAPPGGDWERTSTGSFAKDLTEDDYGGPP